MAVFYKYEYRKKWKNIHPCPNVFGPPGTLLALLNFKDRGFRCYKHLYDNPASHLSHRKASLRKYATGHGASLADIAALSKSKPSWSCCYCCSYETMASNITKIILAPHIFRGEHRGQHVDPEPAVHDQEAGPHLEISQTNLSGKVRNHEWKLLDAYQSSQLSWIDIIWMKWKL